MQLGQGLYVTAVGMGLVFLSLTVLLLAVMALDKLFPTREDADVGVAATPAEPSGPARAGTTESSESSASGDEAFEATLEGKKRSLELGRRQDDSRRVVVDGQAHLVDVTNDGGGRLEIDGRAYRAEVLEVQAGRVRVRVEGSTFEVELPEISARLEAFSTLEDAAEGEPVPAPLTGKFSV